MNTYAEKRNIGFRAARAVYLVFEGIASAAVAVLVVFTWFISATWPSSRH
jgi:hypothetical protein